MEDDLQILQEIPGKSSALGALGGQMSLSALLGGAGGSSSGFFNAPSILQAQDPFFPLTNLGAAGSSSSSNTMDILQKCKCCNKLCKSYNIAHVDTIKTQTRKSGF